MTREILFSPAKNVQAIRFHDGRATFCTWAKRAGKSDLWLTERTGHTPTSQMLARYTRMAQMLADLDYQPFPCVLHAIPELAPSKREECPVCSPALSTSLSTKPIDTLPTGAPSLKDFPFESVECEGRDSNLPSGVGETLKRYAILHANAAEGRSVFGKKRVDASARESTGDEWVRAMFGQRLGNSGEACHAEVQIAGAILRLDSVPAVRVEARL